MRNILWVLAAVTGLVAGDPICLEGAKRRIPDDKCSSYLECVKGRPEVKSCWLGQRYDPASKSCKLWMRVDCAKMCKEGDRRPVEDDCSSYRECVDGSYMEIKCPKGHRFDPEASACTYTGIAVLGNCREYETCRGKIMTKTKCWWWMKFDPAWGQCRMSWKVKCEHDRQCKEYSRRPVEGSCTDYEECQGGEFIRQACLLDKHFDRVTTTCVKPKDSNCVPNKLDAVCRDGEKYPDSKDCQSYLECIGGTKMERKSCWTMMRFDPIKKECRMRWSVECPKIPLTEDKTTEREIHTTTEAGFKDCESAERRPVEDSCTDYLECQGGRLVRQTCLLNKHFDSNTLVCLKPALAKCYSSH